MQMHDKNLSRLPGLITRHFKLKTKLVLLYLITVAIPFLVIGYVISTISGNKVMEQTTVIVKNSTNQLTQNVKESMVYNFDTVNRLSIDGNLMSYLQPSKVYDNDLDIMDAYRSYLQPAIYYDYNVKSPYASIKIYFTNETLRQDYNNYIYADNKIRESMVFKKAEKEPGKCHVFYDKGIIYISKALMHQGLDFIGVVSISFDEKRLLELFGTSTFKTVMIVDSNGHIISSTERNLVGHSICDRDYFIKMKGITGIIDYYENGNYQAIYNTIHFAANTEDLKVINLVSVDSVLGEGNKLRNTGLLLCLLSTLVSCGIIIFATEKILVQLRILQNRMKGVRHGEFLPVVSIGSYDEIGDLTENYNIMVNYLEDLIYKNYEVSLKLKDSLIKKREAELYALESQINPHFLFNMLESIRMGLYNKGDNETADVVMNLSKMLRNNLNWKDDTIIISDEIALVKSYLELQKYRFGDKINYHLDIPQNCLECLIPRFTLQPVVENAIKHGLENKRGMGNITIQCRKTQMYLTIAVVDDGAGIDSIRLKQIRDELNYKGDLARSKSIGLKNVNDRILLNYGDGYGVDIDSTVNEGTLVSLRIPVIIKISEMEKANDVQSNDCG